MGLKPEETQLGNIQLPQFVSLDFFCFSTQTKVTFCIKKTDTIYPAIMGIRKHVRLLSVLLAGLAGASLLVIGFGLTPLSGSVLGSMLGLGTKGDFSLSPSSSYISVPQGSTGTISLMISSLNHFGGDVSLTATITTRSSTPIVAISQSSVNISPDATGSVSLSISTTTSTTLGYYNITAQGRAATVSHSTTISVQVTPPPPPPTPDFYLSANPSYPTTSQGSRVNTTLTISSILNYAGNISLSASVYPSGTNSPTVSLTRRSLILLSGGMNTSIAMIGTFNATVGSYTLAVIGSSGSLHHELDIPLSVTAFKGVESLFLEVYSFPSQTSASLWIRNVGTTTSTLLTYYVKDAFNNQYALTSWAGPVIAPNSLGNAAINIGTSCPGCVLTGSAFTFVAGNSYSITVVTRYNNQFSFTVTVPSNEALGLDSYAFNSGTNVTLYVRNTGAVSVQLVAYGVSDPSGDLYTDQAWTGPTISPGGVVAVNVLIGSSCGSSCTLTGNAFTFTAGYSYTIRFVTARNNQFTFTVTR